MFLVRSAFWLTVAFLVIKPGVDLERTAQDLSGQALSAGRQVVAEAIAAEACTSLTCIGGKAMLSAAIAEPAPAAGPVAPLAAPDAVPLPRPRPDRAG